jgi:RNA polymerase sigma-70 factor (ECF subfamily)
MTSSATSPPRAASELDPELDAEGGAERTADEEQRIARALLEHFATVWRALRRLGVDERNADDAAQRVFMNFSRRIRIVEAGRERPYLLGIAAHVAANARREQARVEEPIAEQDRAPESARDPETLLEARQRRELLDRALGTLPNEQRQVFVLYELEGFSLPEIAAALQIPLGTATSRLRRARASFEAWVSEHLPLAGAP